MIYVDNLIPEVYEDLSKKYCTCKSRCVGDFYTLFEYCWYGPRQASSTTTSPLFGNLFGESYDDSDSVEYLETIEDLINMSRIEVKDMLQRYRWANFLIRDEFSGSEYMAEDWTSFLHPTYGWCHTFDPKNPDHNSKISEGLAPIISKQAQDGKEETGWQGMIGFEMVFNVSELENISVFSVLFQ